MAKYPVIKAGQWVRPNMERYLMACCDCGLVHMMSFRIAHKMVEFRAFRHVGETAAIRKRRRYTHRKATDSGMSVEGFAPLPRRKRARTGVACGMFA